MALVCCGDHEWCFGIRATSDPLSVLVLDHRARSRYDREYRVGGGDLIGLSARKSQYSERKDDAFERSGWQRAGGRSLECESLVSASTQAWRPI